MWRTRWYLYAILLQMKNYVNVELIIDYLVDKGFADEDKKKLRSNWKDIIRHVELSKMYKFSSKSNYERE